ncbi:A24 family peptidase [Rugamonas apoptosis]|uniref:Prepilin peptidase n=1 Tax=Rugamonas apoptosis TaxID=2758570 RepID=A0A7W2F6Y8_9BURK|nr:A24 family peptidase [Rugamonas apoptosis]MBA5686214.1 prepilin peptidase [Rugamonas apoptosis]
MSIDPRILPPAAVLAALLVAAVWHDVRTRRIPNRLVLGGAVAGLAFQALLAPGAGLFTNPFGALGLLNGLAGLGLGLGLLLPMYMLGAMGAGDVKLMAMSGAFLGPHDILGAALLTMIAGGVLALLVALGSGRMGQVLANLRQLLLHALVRAGTGGSARLDAPPAPTGKLAYAIAIAAGTALQVALARFPAWSNLL